MRAKMAEGARGEPQREDLFFLLSSPPSVSSVASGLARPDVGETPLPHPSRGLLQAPFQLCRRRKQFCGVPPPHGREAVERGAGPSLKR